MFVLDWMCTRVIRRGWYQGLSQYNNRLSGVIHFIVNIKRWWDRHILILWIHIPVRRHLYIETGQVFMLHHPMTKLWHVSLSSTWLDWLNRTRHLYQTEAQFYIDRGPLPYQHCLRKWLVGWRHQAITWTKVDVLASTKNRLQNFMLQWKVFDLIDKENRKGS